MDANSELIRCRASQWTLHHRGRSGAPRGRQRRRLHVRPAWFWRSNGVCSLLWPSPVGSWAAGTVAQRPPDGASVRARRGRDRCRLEARAGVRGPSLDAPLRLSSALWGGRKSVRRECFGHLYPLHIRRFRARHHPTTGCDGSRPKTARLPSGDARESQASIFGCLRPKADRRTL